MQVPEQLEEQQGKALNFLFLQREPWWLARKWVRLIFYIALRMVDRDYIKWTKTRISKRKFKKIQRNLEREYPSSRFMPEKLVGREKELRLLLDAFRYHVLRHPMLLNFADEEEVPRTICLSGESGTGKTFLAMVSIRQMLLEACENGFLVSPIIVKGSDIYSEFYGRSTRELSKILERACSKPSIVYVDEFQSLGRKVKGETGSEIEDTRVQDEFNRWMDRIAIDNPRMLIIVATNAYERTREDLRRRFTKVDLSTGFTRDMLLALITANLENEGWDADLASEILELLERGVAVRRKGSITPNDILALFKEVKRSKRAALFRNAYAGPSLSNLAANELKHSISLNDFLEASRVLKIYCEGEKAIEIMDAVCVAKPKETRRDIGGLHDIKNRILNQIAMAFNPMIRELGYHSHCRFLLLGLPGTGKTLIAHVAAAENNVTFIKVRGAELMSGAKYVGEPEQRVKDLFSLLRERSPCILFLDEVDALFWAPDVASNKIVAQIKAELSELKPEDKIVVIATSNREELIDRTIRDRFEPHIYNIHPPLCDEDWNEVVEIHISPLRKYSHAEVGAPRITRMLRRQRVVNPRVAAEVIAEANRLWSAEVTAILELRNANDGKLRKEIAAKFSADLARVENIQAIYAQEGKPIHLSSVSINDYKIRLFHFQKAIETLETADQAAFQNLADALVPEDQQIGVIFGLYTTNLGFGGILVIECTIRPIINGESHVSVTGQTNSILMDKTMLPDDSVKQSAMNAAEAVRSWLWEGRGIDLSKLHFHFQIRSLLEGVPCQGVAGPSAGYAMLLALISSLSGVKPRESTAVTGTIGVKFDIGPVGGLGGRAADAGKLQALLKTKKVRITRLLVPKASYHAAKDEMRFFSEEGIKIYPISNAHDGWELALGLTEEEVLNRVAQRQNLSQAPLISHTG